MQAHSFISNTNPVVHAKRFEMKVQVVLCVSALLAPVLPLHQSRFYFRHYVAHVFRLRGLQSKGTVRVGRVQGRAFLTSGAISATSRSRSTSRRLRRRPN